MLLLLACVTPDSDSATQTFLADGVYEPDCAPWDGAAVTITLGQSSCGANIDGTRVIFKPYVPTTDLIVGFHIEVGESMFAQIGDDPAAMDAAASGSLDVTAVDGELLTVDWSLTTDAGEAFSGTGQISFCDKEIVCG